MARAIDITGQVFNRLTVLNRSGTSSNGSALWLCRCICGNTKEVSTAHLKGGYIQSCGCLKVENGKTQGLSTRKHGARARIDPEYARLYSVWRNMIDRCYRKKCSAYENYGGRGIVVCQEWRDSFEVFKEWAINNGYDVNAAYGVCTLDREDNNGNYCPENCRWITMKAQTHNRRNGRRTNGQYAKAEGGKR